MDQRALNAGNRAGELMRENDLSYCFIWLYSDSAGRESSHLAISCLYAVATLCDMGRSLRRASKSLRS